MPLALARALRVSQSAGDALQSVAKWAAHRASSLGTATPATIEAAIGRTGHHFADADAQSLATRGMVAIGDDGSIALSDAGLATLIELTAAGMAIEDDILKVLDESEVALLRHLLRRLIVGTDAGVPNLWAGQPAEPT